MESGGISERIVDLAMAIVGRVRGGLAMVAVVAEILFSGISGSTAADVSAISSLLVPSMRRAGYSGPDPVSVVAAASAMGILVPPCLTMVVLGSLVNLSIVTLFLAGFIPAFVLAAALLVLIALRARRQGWPVSQPVARAGLWRARAARGSADRASGPAVRRHLLRRDDGDRGGAARGRLCARGGHRHRRHQARASSIGQLAQSGIVTATTLWVLAAASAFAWILVREWVPQMLGEWIGGAGAGRAAFLALTIVLFVVIGALLEGLPALLIFGPILFPISRARRHRSGPLRHRDRRRDGHRVLSAAGRRRPHDRGRHRARGHRRRQPDLCAVSDCAARRTLADCRLPRDYPHPPSPVPGL